MGILKAANIIGAITIVVLMIVLLFMVVWYNQNLTGAVIVDNQAQKVDQLENSLNEKNIRINTLQQENSNLKTQLAELKQEVEEAIENVQPSKSPVATTPVDTTLPPGPTDIDLTKAREDLTLKKQQQLELEAVYSSREDRTSQFINEKIASIKSSNALLAGKFSEHRITLLCRVSENQLFTVIQGKSYDTGLVWYYDAFGLGSLRSRSVSLTEAKDYEQNLTCDT